MNNAITVLCSGGIDSTALINYYLKKQRNVYGLHFCYGQSSEESELNAITSIAKHYSIPLSIVNLGFDINIKNREYSCRNALFILCAAAKLPENSSTIAIGIHKGIPYYDCSKRFIEECQRLIDGYFAGTVIIDAPFIEYSKKQIFEYCVEEQVPLKMTYSCEDKNDKPCGICPSCIDRRLLKWR